LDTVISSEGGESVGDDNSTAGNCTERGVTVRGRAVARVVPPGERGQPRVDVDRETIRRILAIEIDRTLASELDAVEEPVDDPWTAG
jgi:hypothetical protein